MLTYRLIADTELYVEYSYLPEDEDFYEGILRIFKKDGRIEHIKVPPKAFAPYIYLIEQYVMGFRAFREYRKSGRITLC